MGWNAGQDRNSSRLAPSSPSRFGTREFKSARRIKQTLGGQARSCVVKPATQSFYELAVRRAVERVVASLDAFEHPFRARTPKPRSFLKGEPNMNVEIKALPALRVATLRHVGPYNRISEAFGRLGPLAG
jgi:hypothetical protein